jgi:hypothetical protein
VHVAAAVPGAACHKFSAIFPSTKAENFAALAGNDASKLALLRFTFVLNDWLVFTSEYFPALQKVH